MEGGGGGGGGSGLTPYAKLAELKDLENHMIDRLRITADTCDKMQRAINQLVGDVERVTNSHNAGERERVSNVSSADGLGKGWGGVGWGAGLGCLGCAVTCGELW